MAEGNRTLWVAVAGIAATALVGLAGTTAAWLSARDDRAAQRQLARDQRTYDRRVSVYLDAIDFFQKQRATLTRVTNVYCEAGCDEISYPAIPPTRLTTRLQAFGSARAIATFQKTLRTSQGIPGLSALSGQTNGRPLLKYYLSGYSADHGKKFVAHYHELNDQILRFEEVVHDEIG